MTVYVGTEVFFEVGTPGEDGESAVERWASYDFDPDTKPDEDQVYQYARDARAIIVTATKKAGNRIDPPSTNAPDDDIKKMLETANAIGAAWFARDHVAVRTGREPDREAADRLAVKWDVYMGAGASSGGTALGIGEGGLLHDAISSQASTDTMNNDLEAGDTALEATSTRTVTPEFSMEDEE